jgi:hypothetical protein
MIAIYKINGYVLNLVLGILPSVDKTTADSFEKPAGIVQAESYQWAEGILEIDVDAPVILKPRVFIIKGCMIVDNVDDYGATKMALKSLIYQPYVTLEAVHLGEKANARIQPDGISWHRLTNLSNNKIAVNIELRFDELLQPLPFKDNGQETITYYITNGGDYILTENDENYIA